MDLEAFYAATDDLFPHLESLTHDIPSNMFNRASPPISIDWRETPQAHFFQADLPGVKKEDVKLEIRNGVMEISGKQPEEAVKDDGSVWHSMERTVHFSGGSLLRRIGLPADANVDEVKATMANGVLTVTIPKKEARKPQVKKVEIEEVNKEGLGKKIVKSIKGIVAPAKAK